MSARFVIQRSHTGVSYALEYGSPRYQMTREERKRRIEIELSDEGERLLTLEGAIQLFELGALRNSWLWTRPAPPPLKAEDAKAFARYREKRTVLPQYPETELERLAHRRHVLESYKVRRAAVASVGEFCRRLNGL